MKAGKSWALLLALALLLPLAACEEERDSLLDDWDHPSPVIRAGAVQSLAQIGDEEAYRLVVRSLQDQSSVVRMSAVQALGDFTKRDTTAAVVLASRDADPEVRGAAVGVLGKLGGDMARRALVRMILFGESDTAVRTQVFSTLENMGLSGERLSGEIAESQMSWIRENLEEATGLALVRLVRQAGRSVHPGGIDVVLKALESHKLDVVLAGLKVLDGRGGQRALQRLKLLVSDPVEEIRLEAIVAAKAFGDMGLVLLHACLRDPAPKVRVQALSALATATKAPPATALCPLLTDRDDEVGLLAASLVHGKGLTCDLDGLNDALKTGGREGFRQVALVLGRVEGDRALAILRAHQAKVDGPDRGWLLVALAHAGASFSEVGPALEREIESRLSREESISEDWFGKDKLPALRGVQVEAPVAKPDGEEKADPNPKESAGKRLSEAELAELLVKHGLPAASENTPRGLSDLLAGYAPAKEKSFARNLFRPVFSEDQTLLASLIGALWKLKVEQARPFALRALSVSAPGIQAATCRQLLEQRDKDFKLELNESAVTALGRLLSTGKPEERRLASDLVGRLKDKRLSPAILAGLENSNWETKAALIETLGGLKDKTTLPALTRLLDGYSAIPAARALAKLGNPDAIEALRKAMERAGPAEIQEIQLALARLGDREVLEMASKDLHASNPRVRQNAVRILGSLGGKAATEALKSTRFDLDRLVRKEAKLALEKRMTGESTHGQHPQDQGRGGQPTPQR
ncbi:MAG: HEAT repeat domain-containing protein [Deltaproteobacteria bacterium]|nr:HEAT repeat domain-containing protein [Deltaproteobacteria bacterium]